MLVGRAGSSPGRGETLTEPLFLQLRCRGLTLGLGSEKHTDQLKMTTRDPLRSQKGLLL